MNEIDNIDAINEVFVEIGKILSKAIESILDFIDELEPYQRYELLHPQKKPRGSIRRARKGKRVNTDADS